MASVDIVYEQVSVRCVTAYCPACEVGEIVPFLRARETAPPAVRNLASGDLENYRAAEAAVRTWAGIHAETVHGAALAAV